MIWKCTYCDHQQEGKPNLICPNCGIVLAGVGTHQKYKILRDYCYPLSLIMRNQKFEHFFIDACAGSGKVLDLNTKLIDGSPLIMTKTREWVQSRIKDKTKKHSVQCLFIEYNVKTFKILQEVLNPYEFIKCYRGDANIFLPKILDQISDIFAFIYIDPFGLGNPAIQYNTIKKVLERSFTELFIHFSWEGVSRMTGHLKNLDHDDLKKRERARSVVKSLDNYMTNKWRQIEEKGLRPKKRRKEYIKLYEIILRQYYNDVQYIEIPIGSRNPSYYLFFTTRNKTGNKIMKGILDKHKRKGSLAIDSFFK